MLSAHLFLWLGVIGSGGDGGYDGDNKWLVIRRFNISVLFSVLLAFCCEPESAVEQTVQLPMNLDV